MSGGASLRMMQSFFTNGSFDLLLGRRTYDSFAAFWPYAKGNPMGEIFDRMRKYVVTRGPEAADLAKQ